MVKLTLVHDSGNIIIVQTSDDTGVLSLAQLNWQTLDNVSKEW